MSNYFGPPRRWYLEDWNTWNRGRRTADMSSVESETRHEAVGAAEIEWTDFNIKFVESEVVLKKKKRQQAISGLLSKLGV